jgi:hypothetical protein
MSEQTNYINLDTILGEKQETAKDQVIVIQEAITPITPTRIVDWDRILDEVSYKLPKGYPTIVDGVFTEREEIIIINEALVAEGLSTLPLPEATSPYNQGVADSILASSAFKNLINIQKVDSSTPSKNKVSYKLYVSGLKDSERSAKSDELVKSFLKSVPKGLKNVKATTVERERGKKNIIINVDNYIYEFVLKVHKEAGTDTDVKEGFSVACAYFPSTIEKLDVANIINYVKPFKQFLQKDRIEGLSKETQAKLIGYLDKIAKTKDVKLLKAYAIILNQNISHANTFGEFFQYNPDYYIERDVLFNKIRSVASKILSMDKDKWCPGDVYFVRNGSESIIEKRLTDAAAARSKEQGIQLINSLFSDIYEGKASSKTPIVAVSLKQAKAQGGKLKSALDVYSSTPTDYNLSSTEIKYKLDDYLRGIESFQKAMKSAQAKERETTYSWPMLDTKAYKNKQLTKDQMEVIRFKYAAYKALNFILNQVAKEPADLDTALVSLTAFGLGLVQQKEGSQYVNPPFFKVIASADGSATKPQFFKPGTLVTLLPYDGLKGKPEIKVNDSPNYKGLQMSFVAGIGDEKYMLEVNFRPNGSTQLTIELGRPKHI